MFILYAVILGIISGYAAKGNLKYINSRPLYWKPFPLAALAIQLIIFSKLDFVKILPSVLIIIMHFISYVFLLIFILKNLKNIGISIAGTGIFLNSLVIMLNGGYMPTIPENLKNTSVGGSAELINQGEAVHNSAKLTSETLLPWLGDVFQLPSWMPLSNVFSIGDVVIAAGIFIYIVVNMHPVRKDTAQNSQT